jgi:regulatory protein
VKSEAPDTPTELKVRALRLLAQREHSRAELERKLKAHAASPEALETLLSELEQKRQLSDSRYAQTRSDWLSRKYGAAKIRHDLKANGVDPQIIERVARDDELERARGILARKYREPAGTREERAKRARFLQGRGFSYEVIRRLVLLSDPEF